jgi:hypothetical protein
MLKKTTRLWPAVFFFADLCKSTYANKIKNRVRETMYFWRGVLSRLSLIPMLLIAGVQTAESFEMDVIETADMRLLYIDPLQTYLTPHTARSFHNSLEFQRVVFGWTPWDKTTVLLTDFRDYGNASAAASPFNGIMVDVAPLQHTFETIPATERMYLYMNHELVHVATMDGWNQQDKFWRRLFGGKPMPTEKHPETILYNYLTVPRLSVPRWYLEGSAVFMETWMAGGLGRGQGAFDEMVFRSMVRDDAHFYSNLGIVSAGIAVDFQTMTNAYLYGTRFFSYMALQYSPEKVVDWLKRGDDSKRYYATQFEHIFGQSVEDAWDDWIVWEHEFQMANLESVRETPITPTRHLADQGLGSVSKAYIDPETGSLIGAFRYPGIVAHVGILSLDDGSIERLNDIKGAMKYSVTSTAYDPLNKTFFFTADNSMYRDLMAVDVTSGKTRMLLKDARIGDLAFSRADRSLWGFRHLNGYVTLVNMPYPYEEWNQVYTWPYGQIPFELDISPDGKLMSASVGEIDGHQFLRVFNLSDVMAGDIEPIAQFDFGTAIPEGFVFSPDGRYLFGSSYYTGVSNIFRYEISTKDLQAVSNAESGFFHPIPLEDGSLIVYEYTGLGFVPTVIDPIPLEDLSAITFLGSEIARKHPVVKEWAVGSPVNVPLDSLITNRGKYNPRKELELSSSYPIIEGYQGSYALGWNWIFQDPMMLNTLNMNVSYSLLDTDDLSSSERLHADVEYRMLNWRFRYWHNDADFYDLFGPTKRARKGDAFIVVHNRSLIYDEPRSMDLEVGLAYYTGLDTLPNNQNVPTQFEDLLSAQVELDYTHTRKSVGAVDHEKGFRWDTVAYFDYADSDFVPKVRAGFDFGFALPWKHSSIWFYNSAGVAGGDRDNTLANWYFGAFGNNWVDDGEVRRYREFHSFPGFEIDEIYGQDFFKSVLEWNLPPLRFEEVGTPSFFLQSMQTALIAGGLLTDMGNSELRETYTSVGIQIDLSFTVIHRLPMTLSVGYAHGLSGGAEQGNEVMVSLKIL